MWLRRTIVSLLGLAAICPGARADSYAGADWAVRFNLPDQNSFPSTARRDEYVIREAFLARIDALASNDWGCLATYTFSGPSSSAGAAGPVLAAVSNALARGARMAFVTDHGVNIASNWWPGVSLASLAARPGNALDLSQAPPDGGIMHNKVGVFWYRASTQGWVLSTSWNFTGGASSFQWNILTEIHNNDVAAAYSNEMREMLSGRFHAQTNKSHAHDGTRFRLAGTARDGWVRFAPYPDATYGGSNALSDIVAAIDTATNEIVFALNKLTRVDVVNALVRACDRGVRVNGTIPLSDRAAGRDSYAMVQMLTTPATYATDNRMFLYDAYSTAAKTAYDTGQSDLTHTKYLVIDPWGADPLVIHGSANWTEAALVSDRLNDENVLFLPHGGMARAFAAQFNAMTDGILPRCGLGSGGSAGVSRLSVWLPYTNQYEVVHATGLVDLTSWTNRVQLLPVGRGTHSVQVTNPAVKGFYRIQQVP